jgi:Arc-like DNA binding domain
LAGESKPYRFLLRMSEELRHRLAAAAKRSGRSLNREIVERLEASFDDRANPDAADVPAWPHHQSQIGGAMTRRRRRLVALGATLAAAALAIAGAIMLGLERESEEGVEPEFPTALGKHLEKLGEAAPAVKTEEGPDSRAAWKFEQQAYPAADIALSKIVTSRGAAINAHGRPFPPGHGAKGSWVSVGPYTALYPFSELRNAYSYVPNEYIASGRTTALAIAPSCKPGNCRLWAGAAGGGIWTTKNALAGTPKWEFVSATFGIQAVSSIAIDPNDASGDTVWVGTGEANASGDSAAGVGLYKTTDGGASWTGPLGTHVFNSRAVGSIAVVPGSPNTILAASTRAVRGVSSVSGGGVSLIPGAPQWGLYRSTDDGATWTFIHNGSADTTQCQGNSLEAANGTPCSPRGVRYVVLDPSNPHVVYASSYARGIWRSPDGGVTWAQIKPSLNAAQTTTRAAIAVTKLPNGKTRMYVYEGNVGSPYSRLFRSDEVATGVPVFTDLTSSNPADPGFATYNLCTGQCWYDVFVYTPTGYPDVVYAGGSYAYGETVANKRAVILSTDAGVTGYDMTYDGTDQLHPNGLHPDQHALVTNPSNPYQFFESNDGGMMRSSGTFVDRSSWCDDPNRGLSGSSVTRCKQMLSKIPSHLDSINKGLPTLQFQSLSVNPARSDYLQGGTQDNGTWQSAGNPNKWTNTMIGDGGQSGFDVADKSFRFHTFYNASPDVNFSNGEMADWNWIGDPIYGTEPQSFYVPIISDPVQTRWMFVGTGHVWRTKTDGMGSMTLAELREHCNEWTGDYAVQCGDWQPLGPTLAAPGTYLTAVERTTADSSTLWAGSQTGLVYISKNAGAEPAASVAFTRLDDDAGSGAPGRFVSSIVVDPTDGNHAWIAYTGFDASTPTTPGHVFEVRYDPVAGTSTWTNLSYDLGDLPVNGIAVDFASHDIYAASDFGVFRLASDTTTWTAAAPGMPNVEVAGLTYVGKDRILYAATHGLGAWRLNLG